VSAPRAFSIGIVDRTGALFDVVLDAAESAGLAVTVEELDPTEVGPSSPRHDALLLGPRELKAAGLRRAARYSDAHQTSVLVAVGVPTDGPSRPDLRACGIHQTVRGEPTRAKLRSALTRVAAELERMRVDALDWATDSAITGEEALEMVESAAHIEEPPIDEPVPVPESTTTDRDRAFVITIASPTGGCGKTFYATNLAAILATSGRRCLLVDLDLQFGEVAAALRVRHPYSVYDGLYDAEGVPLPESSLEQHLDELVSHHALGFDVLTAPRDPVMADYVGARDAGRVLDVVETRYDVVVVDTPPSLNEVVLTALDRSDVVAVLATLDVPSLKNLTVLLDTLARLKLDSSRLRLLLNKVEDDIGIDVGQAQEAFDQRFVASIPLAKSVSRSLNMGTVVVEMEPRSDVSAQIRASALAVLPEDLIPSSLVTSTTRASWLSRLLTALRLSRPSPEVSR
jgi:Flp pilus assembly CpaE family ATPase